MLYHLLYPLRDAFSGFNVFRYITFRSAGAVLTALLASFLLAPSMIAWLRRLKVGQQVRVDGPQTHLTKQGTPTMGGLLIIASLATSVLLWSDLTNKYVWVVLFATLAFGGIGFWDDYLKVVKKRFNRPAGISEVRTPDRGVAGDRRYFSINFPATTRRRSFPCRS